MFSKSSKQNPQNVTFDDLLMHFIKQEYDERLSSAASDSSTIIEYHEPLMSPITVPSSNPLFHTLSQPLNITLPSTGPIPELKQVYLSERFYCDKCPSSFNRVHDLRRHQRNHSNYRPYSCKECGYSFTRSDSLRKHLQGKQGYGCKRLNDKRRKRI